jgi:hypothetical protein
VSGCRLFYLNRDLPGFGLFSFGQLQCQHSIVETRRDLPLIDLMPVDPGGPSPLAVTT